MNTSISSQSTATFLPAFVRVFKQAGDLLLTRYALSPSALRALCLSDGDAAPAVRSYLLVAPGATRGIRLVCHQSLREFLGLEWPVPPWPEILRLPPPGGRCPVTGLARTTLVDLTVPNPRNGFLPPVPARAHRRRAALRPRWYISTAALLDYLRSLPAVLPLVSCAVD
jgi:hypothetical protein